jgi:hypothetical protein
MSRYVVDGQNARIASRSSYLAMLLEEVSSRLTRARVRLRDVQDELAGAHEF